MIACSMNINSDNREQIRDCGREEKTRDSSVAVPASIRGAGTRQDDEERDSQQPELGLQRRINKKSTRTLRKQHASLSSEDLTATDGCPNKPAALRPCFDKTQQSAQGERSGDHVNNPFPFMLSLSKRRIDFTNSRQYVGSGLTLPGQLP